MYRQIEWNFTYQCHTTTQTTGFLRSRVRLVIKRNAFCLHTESFCSSRAFTEFNATATTTLNGAFAVKKNHNSTASAQRNMSRQQLEWQRSVKDGYRTYVFDSKSGTKPDTFRSQPSKSNSIHVVTACSRAFLMSQL